MRVNGILSFLSFCDVCGAVDQIVGRDDGPPRPQRQDSHVFRRTGTSPLICWKKVESFQKRDKNVGSFLVRTPLKTNEQHGTFKCARSRGKTCLSFLTLARYRDLSDLLRSPIVSHVPPQMSFIA